MRFAKFMVHLALILVAALIVVSIVSSSYLYLDEYSISQRVSELRDRAKALVGTKDAVVLAASVEDLNSQTGILKGAYDTEAIRVSFSQARLLESNGAIKGSVLLKASASSFPKLELSASPLIYPKIVNEEGKLRILVDHLDIGGIELLYDGKNIAHVPAAITNIMSFGWTLFFRSSELKSFHSIFSLNAQVDAVIPDVAAQIKGSSVTFHFSGKPLSLEVGVSEFMVVSLGKYIYLLASSVG